ncbi:MAG: threonylcarbamoyl-AMP synthase, partial [Verrucomicrobia bacterium]|nr:threonylcarbamoyl-AMP synthase [Verrucomicrobiota bacterium]
MTQMRPFSTRILEISSPQDFDQALEAAHDVLEDGGIVAVPTETVYGLAGDGWNSSAVDRIFQTKGRPSTNPVILHVASMGMLRECALNIPDSVSALAGAFWPGPLTLVLERSERVPALVRLAGHGGCPLARASFMRALIQKLGRPIAAPSANLSTRLSPTTAEHVRAQLNGLIPLIIDGGACNVGIESTVIDLTSDGPTILRPGIIDLDAIQRVLPDLSVSQAASGIPGSPARSPGQMLLHYAPNSPLHLFSHASESQLVEFVQSRNSSPGKTHILSHVARRFQFHWGNFILIPDDPEAYARALYAELFRTDQSHPDQILIEMPP